MIDIPPILYVIEATVQLDYIRNITLSAGLLPNGFVLDGILTVGTYFHLDIHKSTLITLIHFNRCTEHTAIGSSLRMWRISWYPVSIII